MRRYLIPALMTSVLSLGFAGCTEKSTSKTERTVTTPDGKTSVTTETKVEKSGDNPPPP